MAQDSGSWVEAERKYSPWEFENFREEVAFHRISGLSARRSLRSGKLRDLLGVTGSARQAQCRMHSREGGFREVKARAPGERVTKAGQAQIKSRTEESSRD